MDKTEKLILPPPCFDKPQLNKSKSTNIPHFLSPQGMQLPRNLQPPPMYGPRGSTFPPRFIATHYKKNNNGNDSKNNQYTKKFQHKKPSVCENCDMEFKSYEELKTHTSEHKVCGIDGCRFFGYPGIVEKHVEQQHTSGLYEKLRNLSTPEDIEKWRDERKKRYPTRANIELRQKAKEERKKRGEKLENNKSRFGKKSDRRQMPTDNSKSNKPVKRKRRRNQNNPYNRKDDSSIKVKENSNENQMVPLAEPNQILNNDTEQNENNEELSGFRGTSHFPDYQAMKLKNIEKNALSNLVGMYGSEDEESTGNEFEKELKRQKLNESALQKVVINNVNKMSEKSRIDNCIENENQNIKDNIVKDTHTKITQLSEELSANENIDLIQKIEDDDLSDQAPEEVAISKTTDMPEPVLTKRPPKNGKSKIKAKVVRKSGLDYSKLRLRRQNTMLEKLLASDIRHERNILLQCTRFVVENNFFGIGQKSEQN